MLRGDRVDVIVIGAGAVGTYLTARLTSIGASVVTLERRAEPTLHSRAIGVHPPGLDLLDAMGIAEPLVDDGVRVVRGHALAGRRGRAMTTLGIVDFEATLRDRWRCVLTVPQWRTERALEDEVRRQAPGSLYRGVHVRDVRDEEDGVIVDTDAGRWQGRLVVACDGARGRWTEAWGGVAREHPYRDRYLMMDVDDDDESATTWGHDAAIVVHDEGVVEAFPLPGGVRRWVVKVDDATDDRGARSVRRRDQRHGTVPRGQMGPAGTAGDLVDDAVARRVAGIVEARTGRAVDVGTARMTSAFGVRRRHARRVAVGRRWLAGDAAHVVPPIGGQGMTLGWLGAEALVDAVAAWRDGRLDLDVAGRAYERRYTALARAAARRAQVNLSLGRATFGGVPPVGAHLLSRARNLVVRTMLVPPLDRRMAETFTMQR